MLQNVVVDKLFDLFLGIGDQHFRLLVQGLLEDETKELCTKFFNLYLTCTNAPGYYPVNENYSEKTFTFWFLLQVKIIFKLLYIICILLNIFFKF